MATNKQRRDAERLRLQRQLEQRRAREATKKRVVLIGSVVGTLVVIAAVVLAVVATTGGDDKKDDTASQGQRSSAPSGSQSAEKPADCTTAKQAKGAVTFQGVTVGNPTNLKAEPKVCSAGTTNPTKLQYKDLVVGKGKTPALTADVEVQYAGLLYRAGTAFDSSWARGGKSSPFNLQQVVPGFTQGIGGNSAARIPPMKVGGRRIVIVPAALGYPEGRPPTIPANTALVFVIDLVKTS